MHCSWHLSPRASLLTNIDTTEQAFCLSNASMRQQVKKRWFVRLANPIGTKIDN